MKLSPYVAAIALLTPLAACNQPSSEAAVPAVDANAVLSSIREVEGAQIAAINAGDIAGATAVYASDAVLFTPGEDAATGADAIKARFEQAFGDRAYDVQSSDGQSWVADSGDMAATSFTGTWTHTAADGTVKAEPVSNLTVWRESADGTWKIIADHNSVYTAAAPPTTAPQPAAAQ